MIPINAQITKMKSKQSDKKVTKQVRIDAGLHRLLKIKAAETNTSIRELLEGFLAELLAVEQRYEKET